MRGCTQSSDTDVCLQRSGGSGDSGFGCLDCQSRDTALRKAVGQRFLGCGDLRLSLSHFFGRLTQPCSCFADLEDDVFVLVRGGRVGILAVDDVVVGGTVVSDRPVL